MICIDSLSRNIPLSSSFSSSFSEAVSTAGMGIIFIPFFVFFCFFLFLSFLEFGIFQLYTIPHPLPVNEENLCITCIICKKKLSHRNTDFFLLIFYQIPTITCTKK